MIDIEKLSFIGTGLSRPECVLAQASGFLHVSDHRGGISILDGKCHIQTVLANGEFRPKPN